MRPTSRALVLGAASAALVPLLALPASAATATASSSSTAPVTLAGSKATWVPSAPVAAETPASRKITLTLDVALRDAAGAEAQAKAVADTKSATYGQYLTPEQYKARYAATDATVARVSSWLTGQGAKVIDTSPVNRWVRVELTAAQAEGIFKVDLKQYSHDGEKVQANDRAVTLPADIASVVTAVQGLTDPTATHSAPPAPAFVNAPPCSTYFGEKLATALPKVKGQVLPYVPCGYTPAQLRSAYDLQKAQDSSARLDGRGVSVAIVDAYNSPTIAADANTYATRRGDAPFAKGQLVDLKPRSYSYGYDDTTNGDQCGEQGWYGEETLDVEAVHGIAPGAKVVYSGASSCQTEDLDAAIRRVVDHHLAQIVSDSWGSTGEDLDPASAAAEHQLFVQAALEGVGIYFSSGDSGDELAATGTRSVDSPASDPFVTAVGGTSIAIGKDGTRQFEAGWSTGKSTLTDGKWTPGYPGTYVYGAGGGTSRLYSQPAYQQGVVPASISKDNGSATPMRAVPDVSAIADPNTGFLEGITETFPDGSVKYGEYRIGGTSLASPVFAGVMAVADQAAGRPHGFANYFLYSLYGSKALYDVPAGSPVVGVARVDYKDQTDFSQGTTTSARYLDADGDQTIHTRTGYDDITGIGTPNGTAFLLAAAGTVFPAGSSSGSGSASAPVKGGAPRG